MSDSPVRPRLRRLLPSLRPQKVPLARAVPVMPVGNFAPLTEVRRFSDPAGSVYDHVALRKRQWFDLDRWFGAALLVLLPTLSASVYYGLIAADRFVSQSEFVLRNSEAADTSGISTMIASQTGGAVASGLSIGGDRDAQAISIYISSHDAMAAVDRAIDLRKAFARPEADWIARYPGPVHSDTNHALFRFYEDMTAVSYDPTTGVIKLSVEAFRPEDARTISEALIGSAEQLVNRMDLRGRQDAMRAAQEQVETGRTQVVAAQQKLTEFRLREQMVDPIKMSGVVIESIAQLVSQSVDLKARLSDLLKNTPNNQQASVLRNQIASLEEQIAAQQRKLAGPDGSLSPIIAEYAQLSLQSEFANRIYTASLEQIEAARAAATRQRAFIERISGPTLADYGTQPKRALMVLLVFAVSLSAWSVLRFVIRDSRMHHGR
ncbi:capsular polysaccharide export system inner membrane protein KpsE [Bosea sp. BIWAKO-01]|nr:capsular polysaccharide export system inner membrane protein KpsE [Bosea sp. BIWAKO-01]